MTLTLRSVGTKTRKRRYRGRPTGKSVKVDERTSPENSSCIGVERAREGGVDREGRVRGRRRDET